MNKKYSNFAGMESLKSKTIKGIVWSAIERFSIQIIQFVVQIIIARLLVPKDYGLIGMLAIFIAIAQTFIDGGFANALIQKKNRNEIDYSTVFYFNFVVGLILSLIFFLSAGFISDFYKMPELKIVIKVMCINLIIISLQVVHKAKLSIEIDFKTQAKASLIGVFISGIVGIYMAYKGYGVWSLVVNIILNNLIQTALLWYFLKWKPLWIFSFDSFTKLFSFGSKILASNLLHTIYLNLYTMIIGKRFSATSLGYYTRADQFAQFPSSNITGILQRVTYPILSSIQDDDERLRNIYRQYVKLFAFIVFPLMLGLAAISKPFIILILTEKWLGVVPLLQILCVYYMWYPINAIHQNLMQVKGRSDLFLKLEFVKKIIGIGLLFISLPFGLNALAWSLVAYSLISLGLNTYYASRLIDFSIKNQLIDILRIFIISSIMAAVVYLINYLDLSNWLKIILAIASGAILYTAMAKIFRFDEINQLINLVRNKV